ncbi:MAG: dTDP-4-dehydrorhamnose 3,5-epimerase [Alphaproteobacteria bacterium]|nr:dTDP-4-dehydrorhamnose 3,5-epimerase [Alphaproteobacteria bacterium]
MIFQATEIDGAFIVGLERHEDERGFFARTYCAEEFGQRGLNTRWPQCNLSHSDRTGTLRGIHYQAPPEPDAKLVRVTRGRIFGVVVELRPDRPAFGRSLCRTMSEHDGAMFYIPAGCGFGFQTLADGTELFYQMSVSYRPELARGVRWDDPDLGIEWPLAPSCVSARDAAFPRLRDIAPAPV